MPEMSKPPRPKNHDTTSWESRTFFVTTGTAAGKALFQTDRMASLFIEVLRFYMKAAKFVIHDFVVMPNHVHVLLTIPGDMSIEKAMQLIKGNFSFRAKKELQYEGEIWQRGFTDVRIRDEQSFLQHQSYIDNNPVRAGLANSVGDYVHGSAYLRRQKSALRANATTV